MSVSWWPLPYFVARQLNTQRTNEASYSALDTIGEKRKRAVRSLPMILTALYHQCPSSLTALAEHRHDRRRILLQKPLEWCFLPEFGALYLAPEVPIPLRQLDHLDHSYRRYLKRIPPKEVWPLTNRSNFLSQYPWRCLTRRGKIKMENGDAHQYKTYTE